MCYEIAIGTAIVTVNATITTGDKITVETVQESAVGAQTVTVTNGEAARPVSPIRT